MRHFSKLFIAFAIAAPIFAFQSCKKDDVVEEDKTVIGTAQKDAELSIFVQAVERAGLTGTLKGNGPFTVFAPTNVAFTAYLSANNYATLSDVPVSVLSNLLLNHVTAGKVLSTQFTTGYVTTLAKYGTTTYGLSMYVRVAIGIELNGGSSNGGASILTTDANISASNGVIHKIRSVMKLPTVVNLAIANPDFTTLVGQLSRNDLGTNLVTTLSATIVPAPYTVFAPTNAAFSAFETERITTLSAISGSTMADLLRYHVVGGANVRSASLTNNQIVTTLSPSNNTFTINISGSNVTIRDSATLPRTTNIVATDVQASNGVIHVVDRVLLNI